MRGQTGPGACKRSDPGGRGATWRDAEGWLPWRGYARMFEWGRTESSGYVSTSLPLTHKSICLRHALYAGCSCVDAKP